MVMQPRIAFRLVPVVRHGCRQIAYPRRYFWSPRWDPVTDMRSMARQMERQMENFDRDMHRFFDRVPFPPRFSRTVPIESSDQAGNYRINVDMSGFRPDDIKVSVKDRELTIQAKMEAKAEDGSHISQQLERRYTLPETVDVEALRSALSSDGVLTIQAPQALAEPPKDIPIEKDTQTHEEPKSS